MPSEELPSPDLLRSFLIRFVQSQKRGEEVNVRAQHRDHFLLMYGVIQRVRRLAQAYVRLTKAGFGIEGRILTRAAVEHAVTAQWAFYTIGGMDRFAVSVSVDQLQFESDFGAPEERIERLLDSVRPGKGMYTWKQIVGDIGETTGFIKNTYRVMSQAVHVTHSATMDGIHEDPDSGIMLVTDPEDDYEHQTLYALTSACLLAAWLSAVFAGDEAEYARLRQWGETLSMPWSIAHYLPPGKVRDDVQLT